MILAKIAELTGLAVFAAAAVIEAVATDLPRGALLEFGALGLVGFMVAQNYRQRANIGRVLERKDAEIQAAHQRAERAAGKFTTAIADMTETFAGRPCLAGEKPQTSSRKDEPS